MAFECKCTPGKLYPNKSALTRHCQTQRHLKYSNQISDLLKQIYSNVTSIIGIPTNLELQIIFPSFLCINKNGVLRKFICASNNFEDDLPCDPITLEPIKHLVVSTESGNKWNSYEHATLEYWLGIRKADPLTNQQLHKSQIAYDLHDMTFSLHYEPKTAVCSFLVQLANCTIEFHPTWDDFAKHEQNTIITYLKSIAQRRLNIIGEIEDEYINLSFHIHMFSDDALLLKKSIYEKYFFIPAID